MIDDDIVFVAGDWRVTRREYRERASRATVVLADLAIHQGNTIGIALRNRPQFFELVAAATSLGAKAVPIAWRLKHGEIRHLVEDSGAKLIIYDNDSAEHVKGLPGISIDEYEERLANITPDVAISGAISGFALELYSSGTTGRPKAIERIIPDEMKAKLSNAGSLGFLQMFGVESPGEVHLVCGPLYHSQPIGFATTALAAGHRIVLMEGSFDAETCLQLIEREKVSWMTCVPTHLIRILALPPETLNKYDLGSLKAILHSASPCPRDVKEKAMALFPPNTVWEVYGGTEGAMTMISPQEAAMKPGSVGRPFIPGTRLRILDEHGNDLPPGEVGLVYATSSMKFRYRNAPELNDDTWHGDLYTLGDMGYLDEDGYLFLTDRKKDMIISGGANVYPAEIEAVLFNHPAVADVAVIGVPDPQWGESVKAIVEPRDDVTEKEIIDYCRQHLAHYKCPTSVSFVVRFPRDPNGKVRKRELREPYWTHEERRV